MNPRSFAFFLVCLALVPARADTPLTLSTSEGVYGMITRPASGESLSSPVMLTVTWSKTTPVRVKLSARDIFDQPVAWTQTVSCQAAGAAPDTEQATFPGEPGFYSITAETTGEPKVTQTLELGIIPPPHPGLRPDSFFASNVALKTGPDLAFLQAIGLKVQRTHFQPDIDPAFTEADWKKPSTGAALPLKFDKLDQNYAATKAAGISVLPLVAYNFSPAYGRTDLALRLAMWGPPRNFDEYVNTWEEILRHYPEITSYEFWNEPWIFGWTWGGTPDEYRKLQTAWCQMALKVNPKMRIVAGSSSMFTRDNIEPFPDCWKGLLQGTSNHPYGPSVGENSYRSGENLRAMDAGAELTREMGLPYYYMTEGGTSYMPTPSKEYAAIQTRLAEIAAKRRGFVTADEKHSPEAKALDQESTALLAQLVALPEPNDNIENAAKVVQYYLNSAIDGAFMGNAQLDIGYGPRWTRSNTTFAVMTNLIEDRPVVADIWPEQQLLTGAIFAAPQSVTPEVKALPRAAELSARWNVPIPTDRANDPTKVAVVWALTGADADHLDTDGRLTLSPRDDLRAYDMTGREIAGTGAALTVPLGPFPVYLTTNKLSVIELHDRIAAARIENVVPVNAYALSLGAPVTEKQPLSIRMENQLNREMSGTVSVKISGTGQMISAPFTVKAGQMLEVPVAWPGLPAVERNRYPIEITAKVGGDPKLKEFSKHQVLAAASFVPRAITVDGSLDDWKGVTPVEIDSSQIKGRVDATPSLLNPGVYTPVVTPKGSHIHARVYTAYDKDNVYIAAAVDEPDLKCTAGAPVAKGRLATKVPLPYRSGIPGGLDYITTCGDVFQFAFGFRDRVPQAGRQMDDPYAWKGQFYDTDYCYAANVSTDGDQLTRLWGADTSRRNGYQTEDVPGIGPVPGAKIKIARDEAKQQTIYEMSIPRAELSLFHPEDKRLRFGFILYNDEKLGTNNGLSWSETAGVFDYLKGDGSFPPTWSPTLPCQTFFGIQTQP